IDFTIVNPWRSFSAAENGLLVTMTPPIRKRVKIMWVDRQGKQTSEIPNLDNVDEMTISPAGQKLLLERIDFRTQKCDLWIHDIGRGITSRLTFHPEYWFTPRFEWSRDGMWVYFSTSRNIFRKPSIGAGEEQTVYEYENVIMPEDISIDGKLLLFSEVQMPTNFNLMVLPLSGNQKPYPFLQTPFNEMHGKFSPDGKWVVFDSDKSGTFEVYVRPFEHPDQSEIQVSTSGGLYGQWRSDGKEIIFDSSYSDNRMMAVDVKYGPSGLELGVPHALFSEPTQAIAMTSLPNFSGFLFAVNTTEEQTSLPLNLVTNWPALLQH
ncbi:MAG TPA: hypothetical protein VH815_08760, partial [Acidobacteriota bacterium]